MGYSISLHRILGNTRTIDIKSSRTAHHIDLFLPKKAVFVPLPQPRYCTLP